MTVLEDDLRRTFAERAGATPALNDPAGTALRRARRIRRHRSLIGGAAATMAVAVLGGGLAAIQDWRLSRPGPGDQVVAADEATPVTETADAVTEPTVEQSLGPEPEVDLFADGYVWTADGVRISVAERDTRFTRAYRVPLGWVLGGAADVRLVNSDGVMVTLPVSSRWVLSADGTRIAYVSDGSLRVARLDRSGLADTATTSVDANTVPLAFAGYQVVVGEIENGRLARVDRWEPNAPYRPNWRQAALTVYEAPVGDVVAQVATATGACLVRLAVATDGLRRTTDEACGIGVASLGPPPTISPDGRWLAVRTPATVAIYDLRTIFDSSPIPTATCGSLETTDLIWESAAKLLAADGRAVVRCGADGTVEPVALPSGLPDGWKFIAARRSNR